MLRATQSKARLSMAAVVLLGSLVIVLAGYSLAGAITISPFKWILNSQGNAQDIQAIIPMTIAAGYTFTEGTATLWLGDDEVAESISMRYCYIDDNLIIGFDKNEVLGHPVVVALAGTTVTATVEGSFTATDAEGKTYTQDFSGSDQVEIVAPGKNSENKK